jgi:hypothetical protein
LGLRESDVETFVKGEIGCQVVVVEGVKAESDDDYQGKPEAEDKHHHEFVGSRCLQRADKPASASNQGGLEDGVDNAYCFESGVHMRTLLAD